MSTDEYHNVGNKVYFLGKPPNTDPADQLKRKGKQVLVTGGSPMEGMKIPGISTFAGPWDVLKEIVTKFYANGKEKMSNSEMKELLLLFHVSTDEEVDRVVIEMDGDGDGVIRFGEFISFLRKEEIRYTVNFGRRRLPYSLTSEVEHYVPWNGTGVEVNLYPLSEMSIHPKHPVPFERGVETLERVLESSFPITDGADHRKVSPSAITYCLLMNGYGMREKDLRYIMTELIMDLEDNGGGGGGAVDLKRFVSFFKKEVFFRSVFEWYYGKESNHPTLAPAVDVLGTYQVNDLPLLCDRFVCPAFERFYVADNFKSNEVDDFSLIGGVGGGKYMEKLEKAFRGFDTDGDGRISAMEVRLVLSSLGRVISLEEAQSITAKIDKDGDGLVDLKDLVGLFPKRDISIDIDGSSVFNPIPEANALTDNYEKWIKKTEILLPITASGAHATASTLSKATSAAGFIACVMVMLLRGTRWEAKAATKVLAKFAAVACVAAVLTSLANDLPRDYAWIVVVLAFVIPLGAVSFA